MQERISCRQRRFWPFVQCATI